MTWPSNELPGDAQPDEAWYEHMRQQAQKRREADARRGVVTDDNLAEVQAEAQQRYLRAFPKPVEPRLAAAGSAQVRAITGARIDNEKIWESDVKPIKRRVDTDAFLARVRLACASRIVNHDPLAANIMRGAEILVYQFKTRGIGFVRATFERLAVLSHAFKRETARKIIRFLVARGLLDVFNVIYRKDNNERRFAANLYLFRDLSEPTPPEPEPGQRDGLTDKLRRYARWFGLKARKKGLNVAGLRPLQPGTG